MTFEQTNEKQRQRMKADARSHMEAARMILASPLYARLRGGEDLYTAVWALWESLCVLASWRPLCERCFSAV